LKSCTSTGEHNDESQQYGNLIATKLRKYNDMTRSLKQNEIFGIFLNAERGLYNQSPYVSTAQPSVATTAATHTPLPDISSEDEFALQEFV
jgi:hypothetical protein